MGNRHSGCALSTGFALHIFNLNRKNLCWGGGGGGDENRSLKLSHLKHGDDPLYAENNSKNRSGTFSQR